jgi:chromosome segregation ATPase
MVAANGGVPIPDPTVLTTEQLVRAIAAERDYVNGQIDVLRERLHGIDRATELLNETVNRVPTDLQKAIVQMRELSDEKFASVAKQFQERDTRSERESRDNKVAVDAAFAAQKEAASEQNKSNTLAIDKSEKATAETLNKQADLFKSTTDALAAQIQDLKERVTIAESRKMGGNEAVTAGRAAVAFAISLVLVVIAVAGFIIALAVKP